MQRSLQRMVRSMWTESGMRRPTLFWNSQPVRSGIARAQDLGKAPQPPPPATFMQARAVVSKTSWLRISGGSYFRLPLWSARAFEFRSSRFSMCPPPLRRLPKSLRDGQKPPCTELRDEVCRVPEGPLRVHVELFTDPGDDGARRRLAIRRFPDQRPDRVQGVQRAAVRAEDDGLAVVDPPRCPGTLRQIRLSH